MFKSSLILVHGDTRQPLGSSLNGEESTLAETLKKKTKACFY